MDLESYNAVRNSFSLHLKEKWLSFTQQASDTSGSSSRDRYLEPLVEHLDSSDLVEVTVQVTTTAAAP